MVQVQLMNWAFNAWAKYPNFARDAEVGRAVERITKLPRVFGQKVYARSKSAPRAASPSMRGLVRRR